MRTLRLCVVLAVVAALGACDNGDSVGGPAGGGGSDAPAADVAGDAGMGDVGGVGSPDAGPDAGPGDTGGTEDAGPGDTGAADTATPPDAGPGDAGPGDASTPDGGPDTADPDVPTCEDLCSAAGALQCDDANGVQTCTDTDGDGCLEWSAPDPCGDLLCVDGHCAVSCQDGCEVSGSKQCDGNQVVTCKDYDQDGCLEWGGGIDCIGGTVCDGGFCSVACAGTDECTVQGAKKCEGDAVVVCADLNFDGCLEWGNATPCPGGQGCSNGSCASSCTDECTVSGARQCDGPGGWQECGELDGDGCLEWGPAVKCGAGEVCSSGFCSTDCQSECTVIGATKCSGKAVQTCADSNGDGCLEWGSAVPCGEGQSCANGFCVIGCTDECTVKGAKTCDGNGTKVCGDSNADGCLEWGTVVACADGQTCSSGSCSTSCADECTVNGAKKCLGSAVQVCGNTDPDACLEWGTATPCGEGESCSNGFCGATCDDECTVKGAKACEGAGVKTCDDLNGDGCLEWGTVVACDAGQSCSSGNCGSTCTDECSVVGAKKCDGSAVATCGDTDADPCLEWGTAVACAPGLGCSNGFCTSTCTDECTVKGAKACEGAGTKVCGDANGDGCLEWGTVTPCGEGQTCSNGSCSSSCTDECTTSGAKACEGDAVKTCGNTDPDACLEWGTAVACDAGLTCSNGSCAIGCADECTVKGARQCSGGAAWQLCDDHDADGCLEWGTATACGGGEVCSNGSCALGCTSECAVVGEKQCNGAGTAVQGCDDWDQDGCLEWGSDVACEAGQVCSSGNCSTTCQDECQAAGLVECTGTGTGTHACGDWNQDGCLSWGTTVPCGQNETCAAGVCEATAAPGEVVINELLYNAAGSDSTAFVELTGEPGLPLDGFSLVGINGANGQEYNVIALTGSVGDDGYFVVAKAGSLPDVVAAADQTSTLADYQNGPDSLQLRWGASVIDAVGYGNFAGATFAGEKAAAADAPEGSSLGRDPLGTDTDDNSKDFHAYAEWTPGAANGAGNQPPSATLVCPASGKTGELLQVDASGSSDGDGTIVGYTFAWGDGFQATGPSPKASHSWSAVGSVEVTVSVTDELGATGQASCTIQILDAYAPTVLITKPAADLQVTQGTFVAGITADVTPAPGRSIVKAELTADGVVVGPADLIAPYLFDFTVPAEAVTDSTIAIQVKATDSLGSVGWSAPRKLFVKNDKPVASFSAVISGNLVASVDATGCTDTETAAAALEVRWDWDDDGTFDTAWSTQKVETHQYAADGAHTIVMEVRDEVGQVSSATRTVNFQAVQDVSGTVTTTLWYGTINITGDVVVPAGETLTISKGTTVVLLEFDQGGDGTGDFDITVQGTLKVEGTPDEPVIFTVFDTDGKQDASAWNRIALATGSGPHTIANAVFEYGDVALDIRAAATLTNVELRNNRIGLWLGSGANVTATDVDVHDSTGDGVVVTAGKLVADGLVVKASGGRGLAFSGGTGHAIADCTVTLNELHGVDVLNAGVSLDACTITSNGQTGLWFHGSAAGGVTHSTVRFNGQEGVRATNAGTASPSPVIQWNNIFENGELGAMVVVDANKTTSSPYAYGNSSLVNWTSPSGDVLFAAASYSEDSTGSSISGQLFGNGASLVSWGSSTGTTYVEPPPGVTTLGIRVDDTYSYGSGTMNLGQVGYVAAAPPRQITTWVTSGKVDARFNYLGAWPGVLPAVTYGSAGSLDLQGFVGAPFDETWDPGPWLGGITVNAATTWSSDVWVTGGITIGSGGSLTVDPGVTVTFVPTDQDGDGRGDWFLRREAGDLTVNGAPGAPVTFDVEGTVPADGGFLYVDATGGGTSTITGAVIRDGWTCLRASGGVVDLDAVDVLDCREHGLHALSAAKVNATDLLIDGATVDAVRLEGAVQAVLDQATLSGSGEWGIEMVGATSPVNKVTNATITDNALGGVRQLKSALALSTSNVKLNGWGVLLQGSASGSVTACNIQSNARDGVLVTTLEGQNPSSTVTGNNIYGNTTALKTVVAQAAKSVASPYAYGNSSTASWTAPGAGHILVYEAAYSEDSTGSSINGQVTSSSPSYSKSWGSSTAASFYDMPTFDAYTTLSIQVIDTYSYGSGTQTLGRVAYTTTAGDGTEMSSVLVSGTFTATGNYWGVTVPTATQVMETVAGTVNYTQFKTTPIAGTGPQL